MSEDLLQALLEPINVVVNQVLAMDFTLVDEADESQTFVDFSEVQHNVFLIVRVCQSNDRA